MSDNKNFNHLMLQYERAYKLCEQVRKTIEEGNIQELDNILRIKGDVLKSIVRFEKTLKTTPQEESQRLKFRKKIEDFEKANIELLTQMQELVKKELQAVAKGKKLTGAYMAKMPETYSSIDIKE